ncbi:hypothetical protein CAPTEDRAFT_47730, partial [Capitella teleta]
RTTKCAPGLYACLDSSCILEQHVCDGVQDCLSGDDESNCHDKCQPGENLASFSYPSICHCSDSTLHFRCSDGECIPFSKMCDCHKDCKDGSDEVGSHLQNCVGVGCHGKFACDDYYGYCLPFKFVCDGVEDCPNGEDE